MNFKKWLLEYEQDVDYDISDPYSAKLPTRRTVFHDIGADVRDDFGKLFAKRMGSAMPSGGPGYSRDEDPIKTFNDRQFLVIVVDEPFHPTGFNPDGEHIRHIMTTAIHKIEANREIVKKLAASRCSFFIDRRKVETKVIEKDGQDFIRFTFRFKMNVTPGHNYEMSDKIDNKFTLDGENNQTDNS